MIVFAAMEISDNARDLCETLQNALRMQTAGSFPRRENLHVTLAYIGETDETKLERIKEVLDAHPAPPDRFLLSRLCAFEGKKGDQVVLLANVSEQFLQYRADLVEQLHQAGIEVDPKPYRPHVTLVRAKRRNIDLNRIHFTPVVSGIDRVVLYQSCEEFGKRVYKTLYVKETAGEIV